MGWRTALKGESVFRSVVVKLDARLKAGVLLGSKLGAHCDEFFGDRGMNTHGSVELRLRRPALDRNGKALKKLTGVVTYHMNTEDAIAFAVDDQLEQDLFARR